MEEKYSDCAKIKQRLTEHRIGKSVSAAAPKVSVIIPAYNVAPFVKETLDSVFAQTYTDFEVILINDGSKDGADLEKVLEPFYDKIIYGRQENLGASQARNAAICLARGTFLAFLDGDDIWLPHYLESQTAFLEKNDFEMIYCDALLFGEPLFAGQNFSQAAPSRGKVTPASLINTACNVITSGTVLNKDLLGKFGMFDTDLPFVQDFDLWFRLAKSGVQIGYQTDVLLKYRVRHGSLSGSNISRSERNIQALEVIRDKYELDERELEILKKQITLCEAENELEKGKFYLANGEFAAAKMHIAKANKFFRKPKLSLINWLIQFSPRLALQVFKRARQAEFSFIIKR